MNKAQLIAQKLAGRVILQHAVARLGFWSGKADKLDLEACYIMQDLAHQLLREAYKLGNLD